LENIKEILETIKNESILEKIELSELDKFIINNIGITQIEIKLLSHIISRESYEDGVPVRKILKLLKDKF
jgi:Holliday junction resolvasome RuvABC ATP-dependent DNA helicase subunit